MQEGNLSFADGMMMRSLVNFPGGLELHIGVCAILQPIINPAKLQQRCTKQPITQRQADITMGITSLRSVTCADVDTSADGPGQRGAAAALAAALPAPGGEHVTRLVGSEQVARRHRSMGTCWTLIYRSAQQHLCFAGHWHICPDRAGARHLCAWSGDNRHI